MVDKELKGLLKCVEYGSYFLIIVLLLGVWSTHNSNNKLCAETIYAAEKCNYNEFSKLCNCNDYIFDPQNIG